MLGVWFDTARRRLWACSPRTVRGLGKGRGTEDWIPAADAGMTEGV